MYHFPSTQFFLRNMPTKSPRQIPRKNQISDFNPMTCLLLTFNHRQIFYTVKALHKSCYINELCQNNQCLYLCTIKWWTFKTKLYNPTRGARGQLRKYTKTGQGGRTSSNQRRLQIQKKRTTGWNWTTDIIISSTTGEVFLPRAKVRTPSVNQASYPDLALAGLILRTFDRSDKVNINVTEPL